MKKTKKLLILCLVLVMTICCCIVPSFSWYSHNGVNSKLDGTKANAIEYSTQLPISGYLDGSTELRASTYKGGLASDGEVSYDETKVITSINEFSADAKTSSTDGEYQTTCYKTVLTNNSSKDVRIGLYLESPEFGSDDAICYGTSDPIWRRISSGTTDSVAEPQKSTTSTMRVYFLRTNSDGETVWDSETVYYIVAKSTSVNSKLYTMSKCTDSSSMYYADIPTDTTSFFVTCENSLTPSRDFRRTDEIKTEKGGNSGGLSATKSIYVYLKTGKMAGDDNQYMQSFTESTTGANIVSFTSNLYLTTSGSATTGSVALQDGNYIGNSVTYASDNTSVATVNSSTGKVTAVGAGTAVITIKVTGANGDTYSVKSTVNVQNPTQTVPLVQNVLVKAGEDATVCWYIDNKTTKEISGIKLMFTL